MKTLIGVGLLVIVALVLSQMHPAPRDIEQPPSWPAMQGTESPSR